MNHTSAPTGIECTLRANTCPSAAVGSTSMRARTRLMWTLVALTVAACGGGGNDDATASAPPPAPGVLRLLPLRTRAGARACARHRLRHRSGSGTGPSTRTCSGASTRSPAAPILLASRAARQIASTATRPIADTTTGGRGQPIDGVSCATNTHSTSTRTFDLRQRTAARGALGLGRSRTATTRCTRTILGRDPCRGADADSASRSVSSSRCGAAR